MATRRVSPGGALLRTSRMFSLPAPIPPPPSDGSTGTNFHSDTATLRFPTHQVITTLPAARKQGDWGLKRPLPLKSTTKSSTPMLRVKAIDTVEQITDYTSGADHGITLKKFQELNMPLSVRRANEDSQSLSLPQKSVFDDEIDVTDIPPDKRAETVDTRWKFTGPWLAGLTQGDFNRWLAREVRPKRPAFREFLRKQIARETHAAQATAALDKGETPPPPIDPSSVTDDQLLDYLRKLRYNNQALYDMVGQFLDLAPLKPPSASEMGLPTHNSARLEFRETKSPYAEHGPPITHPSGGLSYLRTSMYLDNHPIYGPQQQHPSVVARIVRPRRQLTGRPAKLGVAGFIVNTPLGNTVTNTKNNLDNKIFDRLDPAIEGGAKIWVQPTMAKMDSSGSVILHVYDASPEATLVAQELLGNATCLGTQRGVEQRNKPETAKSLRQRYRAADVPDAPLAMSSARDYGLGE